MWKKGLIAGVAILATGIILNFIVGVALPSIATEYQNTDLFLPWTDPRMMGFFAYPFILGVVLAYLWDKVDVKGKDAQTKALHFAKLYFIVATIPGMYITFTSFQVSLPMVLIWTATGFIEAFVAGYVLAKVK